MDVDAIAERRLVLRTKDSVIEVVVSLGRPKQVGPDEWTCEYEVRFGEASTRRAIHGGDSLQALQLSMVSLDVELELAAQSRSGKLYHLDEPFNSILENSGMQPLKSASDSSRSA